jgi:hypothetical protein
LEKNVTQVVFMENYENFMALLANSSAVKVLRARHAPLILGFLFSEFKAKQRLTVPNAELVTKLSDYLEDLRFTDKEECHRRSQGIGPGKIL